MNNDLILKYIPLALKLTIQKNKNKPPSITFEDLKSVAFLGLTLAATNFDPQKGSFATYASIRISGELKDYLKKNIRFDKIIKLEKDNVFFDDSLDTKDFFEFVSKNLSTEESKIIKMYYLDCKTLKEIGVEKKITESRVSQILSDCRKKLKVCLN